MKSHILFDSSNAFALYPFDVDHAIYHYFLISNGAGSSYKLSVSFPLFGRLALRDLCFLSYTLTFSFSSKRGFGYELADYMPNDGEYC